MFALSMGVGMDLCFPDVCLTPAPAPVPIPYPNVAMSATTAPMAFNVLTECTPTINMMSKGLVSMGDQPGVALGVASHLEAGQTAYEVGCFTIIIGGAPAQRMTSVTGQNCMGVMPNGIGACLVPSQVTLLTLG
ncbi:DUF4150 domain-containing protein [Desulfovibrio sp. OttesenSCG-928-M14]|nr:DUF4150 domain-containing protein [Desulfovibrio sp. OttesenSCG-928-M14]